MLLCANFFSSLDHSLRYFATHFFKREEAVRHRTAPFLSRFLCQPKCIVLRNWVVKFFKLKSYNIPDTDLKASVFNPFINVFFFSGIINTEDIA